MGRSTENRRFCCEHCQQLTDIVNRRCEAFPDQIPAEIWQGDNDHREAYPGEHGFEPTPNQITVSTKAKW